MRGGATSQEESSVDHLLDIFVQISFIMATDTSVPSHLFFGNYPCQASSVRVEVDDLTMARIIGNPVGVRPLNIRIPFDEINFLNHYHFNGVHTLFIQIEPLSACKIWESLKPPSRYRFDPASPHHGIKYLVMTFPDRTVFDLLMPNVHYDTVDALFNENWLRSAQSTSDQPPVRSQVQATSPEALATTSSNNAAVAGTSTSSSVEPAGEGQAVSVAEVKNEYNESPEMQPSTSSLGSEIHEGNFLDMFKVSQKYKVVDLEKDVVAFVSNIALDITWPIELIQLRDNYMKTALKRCLNGECKKNKKRKTAINANQST